MTPWHDHDADISLSWFQSAMPAPSFSRETAIRSLRTHDSMALLRANLKEEHILKMDWILTLFKHTLAPPQVARLLVQVRSLHSILQ